MGPFLGTRPKNGLRWIESKGVIFTVTVIFGHPAQKPASPASGSFAWRTLRNLLHGFPLAA
jgi:hypothetical protein